MAVIATTADEAGGRMLAARIATAPRLSAPDAAQKRLDDWLGELDGQPAGTALRRLLAAHPQGACADRSALPTARRISGTWRMPTPSGCVRVLESDPDARLDAIAGRHGRRRFPQRGTKPM